MKNLIIVICLILLLGSCVSKKEYSNLEKERDSLQVELNKLYGQNKEYLKDDLENFVNQYVATEEEMKAKTQYLTSLRENYEKKQKNGTGGQDKNVLTFEHDPNTGRLMTRSELQNYILDYEKFVESANSIGKYYMPKYFFLGKNRVEELLLLVKGYKPPSNDKAHAGYLIKLGLKPDEVGTFVGKRLDAMLIPVALDGSPIFEIAPSGGSTTSTSSPSGSGLDNSGPCPDECP